MKVSRCKKSSTRCIIRYPSTLEDTVNSEETISEYEMLRSILDYVVNSSHEIDVNDTKDTEKLSEAIGETLKKYPEPSEQAMDDLVTRISKLVKKLPQLRAIATAHLLSSILLEMGLEVYPAEEESCTGNCNCKRGSSCLH